MGADAYFNLFTYGTLKRGTAGSRSPVLSSDCELIGTGVVRGTLYDVGAFPALLLDGVDVVEGEIWRCPASLLPLLDEYEGNGEGLFRRAAVDVGGVACWIYVAGPKLGPRLLPEARIGTGKWNG